MTDDWWRPCPEGVTLRVKVQPRARRPGIGGLAPGVDGPRLRLAVTEAAEDGRANRAVCAALAAALGLPASAVSILQGLAAREKLVQIAGNADALAARVRGWA
ncbi:DUF167 domain-containing protein [Belnapia sp. T18]|uniref:UPF0235 protein JMJ56_10300 n=1 Tax=Belnapia arida TaxID=2804533 RepID=A0ABS1U3V0_9PROT|nr:DUF167 domain-containing protein [Belnapia arida]MBL6078397.1 DUF167 domain-containing protein [Belnapia arida]